MSKKREKGLPARIRPFPESYSDDKMSFKVGCLTTLGIATLLILFLIFKRGT